MTTKQTPWKKQTNGGASRTKLSTLLKTNIYKYWVLFCNKAAKIHLQQRNSVHSNNGQMRFFPFRNFPPFNWKAKLVIYYFLLFCRTKQLHYAAHGLETYISMVKQTISTSKVVLSFSFFFLFSGA